jgi:hypothetical protein
MALTDTNAFPYEHWLEPVVWREHICYHPSEGEPNNLNKLLKVTKWIPSHRFDLTDFALYARQYTDPNRIPPEPPTMPVEPNVVEPNAIEPIVQFCFTVGGKHHLYEDCRYLNGKEYIPCVCDQNNLCLTCAARKID